MPASKRRSSPGAAPRTPAVPDVTRPLTISALRSDIRAPGNLIIEVEGARFASIPAERASALGLRAGLVLDPAGVERLVRVAEVEAAHQVALRLLAVRSYSGTELARKLRVKGHPWGPVRAVIERLQSSRLLDDAEFARHFARVRSSRGHGPPRILSDLLVRGVDDTVAKQAIDDVLDCEQVDVLAQARALAEKRAAQLGRLPHQTKLRRLLGYLRRRGYRGREVTQLVREILQRDTE